MKARELLELQLFITGEASAIQWLRQELTKKPQTFQELSPEFMKDLGWAKHEKSLEVGDLLKANFLRYREGEPIPHQILSWMKQSAKHRPKIVAAEERPGGIPEIGLATHDPEMISAAKDRWYVPDPNRAQDLEKLREAALHKEFDTYKQIGSKKLTVFRLEAVRAGFGKAWREKDYDTIIEVAKKILETVLQEDPKLLMYYDNALDRMEGSSTEGYYYSSNTRSEVEMARTTRVISVSVPEKLAEEIEDMAREEGISKSELFRLMARAYKRSQAGERLARLQKELGPGLRAAGLRTEEDVDRFVFEDR